MLSKAVKNRIALNRMRRRWTKEQWTKTRSSRSTGSFYPTRITVPYEVITLPSWVKTAIDGARAGGLDTKDEETSCAE